MTKLLTSAGSFLYPEGVQPTKNLVSGSYAKQVRLDQWEQLMEQLEDLEDAMTALEARLSDTDAPSIPLDEVLAELSLESELVV